MYGDLLHFIENTIINEDEEETMISIELKEMLEKNNNLTIVLTLRGKPIKKIIFKRSEYDKQ